MTTSETGEPRGFTLIEILLAIALIGLMGWIFIGGSAALLEDKGVSPDEQFWKACGAARKEALEGQREVLLSYDDKAKGFVLNDGSQKRTLPLTGTGSDDAVIDFHPVKSDSSSSALIGGTLVETQPLAAGPRPLQRRHLHRLPGPGARQGWRASSAIDPWTCAPMISNTDERP